MGSISRGMLAQAMRALLAAAATTLLAAASVETVAAQGAVKSVHNDWQVRCDTPPGAQGEQCALIQSVTAEDRANVGLTVIVLKTADQKSRLMRVVAPVGVLLPSGLGLKIDQADVGRAGFVRCLPNGCVAEVVMDDNLVKQLRVGQTATFIIFQTPEEGIGFPMSLKGFGEGFDKLPSRAFSGKVETGFPQKMRPTKEATGRFRFNLIETRSNRRGPRHSVNSNRAWRPRKSRRGRLSLPAEPIRVPS